MTAETPRREPDETDDMAAIVRYHGANDVIDALLLVAEEAFGDMAPERLHEIVMRRAANQSFRPESGDA